MLEVLLNFSLATDLLVHSRLDNLRLVETLKGKDVFWLNLGANHVNMARFAIAKRAANVKVQKICPIHVT